MDTARGCDRCSRRLAASGERYPLQGRSLALLIELPQSRIRMTRRIHHMPFGAELAADGRVRFRLWAPGGEAGRARVA